MQDLKTVVFWNLTPCTLVYVYWHSTGSCCHCNPAFIVRIAGSLETTFVPHYMMSHHKHSLPWEPQISCHRYKCSYLEAEIRCLMFQVRSWLRIHMACIITHLANCFKMAGHVTGYSYWVQVKNTSWLVASFQWGCMNDNIWMFEWNSVSLSRAPYKTYTSNINRVERTSMLYV